MEMRERFKQFNDEYLKFELVENKKSSRPDMHAFMMLDMLVDKNRDLIGSASHDEIWLDVELKDMNQGFTDRVICDLVRCGVRYDDEFDCLSMFV